TFSLVTLSAWAPHDSQQKPLRPGSAKTRLASALGVREQKI
ncbi:MAG: SAM-dependent methyltransferase, partial [Rhodobacteraceae bacterium]|nr:SAM-dependent methyltransferase [Paracoccaceae bacterium]